MFFFRTALVGGVAIALLPSDAEKQQALLASASDKLHWAMTYCDRQQAQCEQAQVIWSGFVEKAQFGLHLAGELANQYAAQEPATQDTKARKPAAVKAVTEHRPADAPEQQRAAAAPKKRVKVATIEPIRVQTQMLDPAPLSATDWDKFQPE